LPEIIAGDIKTHFMTTVSCIITSFNNSLYINEAVESVLSQTRVPDEIIVADDASTDGSRDIIRSIAATNKLIKPVFREKNLGVAANRDLAISDASSDFITTLDGDDFYYPAKIEKEIMALDGHAGTITYSDYNRVENDGAVNRLIDLGAFSRLGHRERIRHLLFFPMPVPRDMLIPKNVYEAAGRFAHGLKTYEDWDLKLRLAALDSHWVHSGTTGVAYRKNKKGLSTRKKQERLFTHLQIISGNSDWLIKELGQEAVGKALIKIVGRDIGYRKIILSRKKRFDPFGFRSNETIK
jgi:glycosyltransferase involved in cell wall biosynthesis